MEYRELGRTGLKVSALGFGCGAVGGLIIRADRKTRARAVARAIELGISYFDTARIYGDGMSEANLGQALKDTQADVLVGTKVRPASEDVGTIREAVIASVEGSLKRLQREYVDLVQLHNPLGGGPSRGPDWLDTSAAQEAVGALKAVVAQGKARFWGLNGLGETQAIHEAVSAHNPFSIQACYNLLNPSAGVAVPSTFPFQDYGRLIDLAAAKDTGVIAIRVLAGGALSGTADRHPNAEQSVSPIASGQDYAADVHLAGRFRSLIDEGYVEDPVEAAVRFAISNKTVSTALVGLSSIEQLEQAARYANKGPLPSEALVRLHEVWSGYDRA
jgi:L-galactose dehydrogenase/L-glyceraldehyde 3-phosphate reductase